MIRKDVIFAVITTFCLCALMFTVMPIRSGQPYDPWADLDESGKIDMKDIASVASRFGTAGDSTKNVNVTNWQSARTAYEFEYVGTINSSAPPYHPILNIFCGGYSRIGFFMRPEQASAGTFNLTALLTGLFWFDHPVPYALSTEPVTDPLAFTQTVYVVDGSIRNWGGPYTFLKETKAPYCDLDFKFSLSPSLANSWATFSVYVYLRNE
jgi:hypothetical protein